jgi:hypothetical protein
LEKFPLTQGSHAQDHGVKPARGSPLEVMLIFLKLGLTSFGGPVAHFFYFRRESVVRRAWLDDRHKHRAMRAAAWLKFLFCAARGKSENGTCAPESGE